MEENLDMETPPPGVEVEEKTSLEAKKRWLKPLIFIPLGILVALTLFFSGYKFAQIQQSQITPTPTSIISSPTPTPEKVLNWKIYENEKYGVRFDYPSDWKVELKEEEYRAPAELEPIEVQKIVAIAAKGDGTTLEIKAFSVGGGNPCVLEGEEKAIELKEGSYVSREMVPRKGEESTYFIAFCGGKDCQGPGSEGEFTGEEYNCYAPTLGDYFKKMPPLIELSCQFDRNPSEETLETIDRIIESFDDTSRIF